MAFLVLEDLIDEGSSPRMLIDDFSNCI